MARCVALAACLLALAAGAASQALSCTRGYLRLEFVAPEFSEDPISMCLSSVRLELLADCSVQLRSVQPLVSNYPNLWSAEEDFSGVKYLGCPTSRPPVKAVRGSGSKLEAVRRATIKAFASYVYGLDANAQYIFEIEVPDLDFFPGKLIVKRMEAPNLVYAIVEADVSRNDMLCDDDITPLGELDDCTQLSAPDPFYAADAPDRCMENTVSDEPCKANTYGVNVVADDAKNAWDEKYRTFKVCALCPPGTAGDGNGCTTCKAGFYSQAGGDCIPCEAGFYSNAGSSYCIPCPMGKYSDAPATAECTECPEDTYTWIEGATACLRCIRGIPEECPGGICPSGTPIANVPKSLPATMIATVGPMDSSNPDGCRLTAANPDYEIAAYTKCKGWGDNLQFAFTVYGDCSIQISPISDPTCAYPTTPESGEKYPYGAVQQRAYYYSDGNGNFKIRSLMDTKAGTTRDTILTIEYAGGDRLAAKWFPVTTDALEAYKNPLIRDMPGPEVPEVCSAELTVLGGNILGAGNLNVPITKATWTCPPGSFYSELEICPFCPVGYTCPGGDSKDADRIPCEPNTYNHINGLYDPCTECPGEGKGTFTNYAAAQQCDVERVDLVCDEDRSRSLAYDLASQECKPCPAGTWREYGVETTCTPCPAGTYSAEGDAECSPCPPGEHSPSEGLPDQFDITGHHCVLCAVGSMALTPDAVDKKTTGAGLDARAEPGATFCDACPAGTWLPVFDEPCQLCPQDTYRAGDATPENNVCKPIPPGYRLADTTHHTIVLCEVGTVSFYDNGDQDTGVRIPENDETKCIACSAIDPSRGTNEWAHTHAPRKGMTQCIPCPAGTVPNDVNGATTSCKSCPDGRYRDAYEITDTCKECPAGNEVGPNNKGDCTQCRPGTFMTATRARRGNVDSNTCELCPRHQYRPTFGATSCLFCPRGTQTANTGNVECTACPIGYFNNKEGAACQPAPEGTFVNTTGAFASTACPRGTWNNEKGQDNCNPCAPGRFSNTLGSKECKTCPAGTYSPGQAVDCFACRPGYFSRSGSAACAPCKPGLYAPDARSATCKLCPKGFQCPTNAMSKAGPCPRGTFGAQEGLRLCTPCPINTYSAGGGTTANPNAVMACIKCRPGTNTRGLTGQSRCQVLRPQVRRLQL